MRNKKIQILLVFVLAIGLFGLLFYWRYGEKKQMESLNGLQETYKEYDKKIREIRNDMENKKAEVNDIEKPANVILAFSEEDQELMDRIVPALEGRGIQATLVLKNTAEHHQETVTYLGQQGWDFAFGGEIGEEKDAYIEMRKVLSNNTKKVRERLRAPIFLTVRNMEEEARFYIRILKKWILRSGWLLRKMHLL